MARDFPYFPFYPEDFATGTLAMSPLAVGIYIRCLCHQWGHGSVPNDLEAIARITGATADEAARAWPSVSSKFIDLENGTLCNARLESERAKVEKQAKRRTQAGKKGAKVRWKTHSERNAEADADALPNTMRNGCDDDSKTIARAFGSGSGSGSGFGSESDSGTSALEQVISHYQGYHPRAKAGKKERAKIRSRLKEGFSAEDLQLAIDGCHVSKFHSGENEAGQKYQTLELIVRDASKVTKFIELAGEHGGPQLLEKSRRSLEAFNRFVLRQSHEQEQ